MKVHELRSCGTRIRAGLAAGLVLAIAGLASPVVAEDTIAIRPEILEELRREVRELRADNAESRRMIGELKERLEKTEAAPGGETAVEDDPGVPPGLSAYAPGDRLSRLAGTNRFIVTGWGAAGFEWEEDDDANTFSAVAVPIFLYRVTDRVLFEVEPEFELESSGGTEVNLEYAQADVRVNEYATLVAGKFLLPFGEFIQQLHPAWINKLASNPLPYLEGEEGGLLPFSDVGAQVRGGVRLLDREGVDFEYTIFAANGPRFEGDDLGAPLIANNLDLNRGKAFGLRLAVYPLPLDLERGRLKIGASTYDGTWDDGNDLWFTSWGVDVAYQLDELEVRGEYLRTVREFRGIGDDRRDGWYAQAAYKLTRLGAAPWNRMELVARIAGIEQRDLLIEGEDGEIELFASDETEDEPRLADPRRVSFGLNYWLTPSVVGKLEYDFGFAPRAPDEHHFQAQLAVGF